MYMNVQDFRKNLKSAFDAALTGDPVLIERGGITFKLVADVVTFQPRAPQQVVKSFTEKVVSDKVEIPILKTNQEVVETLNKAPVPTESRFGLNDRLKTTRFTCKHGFLPEFCKFSKPGKPCK